MKSATVLLALAGTANAAAAASPQWSMLGYDAKRTGQTDFPTIEKPDLHCELQLPNSSEKVYSGTAVDEDGNMYVGTLIQRPAGGYMYSIDSDCNINWRVDVGNWIESSPTLGEDGLVYVGIKGGDFIAFNAEDGTEAWKFRTQDDVMCSPLVHDGKVFVGSRDTNFYAFDAKTGEVAWKAPLSGDGHASPALGDNGYLYIGSAIALDFQPREDGNVTRRLQPSLPNQDYFAYAFDLDGNEMWKTLMPDQLYGSPAVDGNGNVIFGCYDGNTYQLDGNTGEILWTFEAEDITIAAASIVKSDGSVLMGSFNGNLYNLDGETGEQKWAFDTNFLPGIYGGAAITLDGTIYIGNYDGTLFALNSDGTEKWRWNVLHPGVTPLGRAIQNGITVLPSGRIITGSWDGHLYVLTDADLESQK
jgi:outer membrane protein assembly factor BamB